MSIKWGDVIKTNTIKNKEIYDLNKKVMKKEILDMLLELQVGITFNDVKCNRCRIYRKEIDFYNLDGRLMKTCDKCRFFCNRNQKKYNKKIKNKRTL